MPTTIASPASVPPPAATAWPALFISAASSRPWRAIQMLCQASMTTATMRIAALKSSWPTPAKADDSACTKSATSPAPRTPPRTPAPIHQPRSAMPRVTAMVMPTMRPASMTSRKTMMSAPSITVLLRDDGALRGALVILAEEGVAPGLERLQRDFRLAVAGDHLLDAERLALELLG